MTNPEVTKTETVWAAQYAYYDGTVKHQETDDEDHARLIVESVLTHLATLNEPTRRVKGVERCELVWRIVTHFADGSEHRAAWALADDQPKPMEED